MFQSYPILMGALFLLGGFCTHAVANPASTEYVQTTVDALRQEIKSHLNTQQTKIDNLNNKIKTYRIGNITHGGMVFWVDQSEQHGLVVSLQDLNHGQGIQWCNGEAGERIVNATAQGLGAGETNTRLIVSQQTEDEQEGIFAALVAANYQITEDGLTPCSQPLKTTQSCYSGWYLPSVYELMLLHANLNQTQILELNPSRYWTSSEYNTTKAWALDLSQGEVVLGDKSYPALIRAIRAF